MPESPEVGKSGVAADLVLLADSLVLGAVHLRDLHLKTENITVIREEVLEILETQPCERISNLFIFLEGLGQFLPSGGQLLAMAAPEEEFNDSRKGR